MASDDWAADQATLFIAGYEESSLGAPPGMLAATAYQMTWLAISQLANEHGIERFDSPVSSLTFDEDGRLVNAPVYLYSWQDGERELITRLH